MSNHKALKLLPQLLLNARSHFTLSDAMTRAGLPRKAEFYKSMRFRYLRKYYLGGGFSVSDRLAVATNHYTVLAQHFRPEFVVQSQSHGYQLWNKENNGDVYAIHLRFPYFYNFDGDLCLTFTCNDVDVCVISLSIAPGHIAGSSARQVVLISGIQGIVGKIDQVRSITENCNNVTPAHMLVMAAEMLATTVGARAVVGLGAGEESKAADERCLFDYDAFWMPLLGKEQAQPTYQLELPFVDKPIELIPAKHRGRARKRRELRTQMRESIHAQALASLRSDCLKTPHRTATVRLLQSA